MEVIRSINGILIRVPEERWFHITEEHSEMAGYYFEILETIEEPEAVYQGKSGEYLAIKEVEKGKYIVAIYKEVTKDDGFLITAFLTKRKNQFERRQKIWPQ